MNAPLVSVIIPLYNAEKYIVETIQSAIDQTWNNLEIIVVDDGSTDNSLTVAQQFDNKKVKILSQKNKGASAARNHGLREAKGDYIQFLDADDLLSSNKIEEQVKVLDGSVDKVAICHTIHFFDGEIPLPTSAHEWFANPSDDPIDFLTKLYGGPLIGPGYGGMIQPNAWLSPRKIIDKAGWWNEELSLDDDGEFFCRVILESKGTLYAKDAINYYRKFVVGKSLSASNSYKAHQSAYLSTQLKTKHLLSRTHNPLSKMALARFFMETAFNTYPMYKDLSYLAENNAKDLGGCFFDPYPFGYKKILSSLIGWKKVRELEFIKRRVENAFN